MAKFDMTVKMDGQEETDTIEASSLKAAETEAKEDAKEFNSIVGKDAVEIESVTPHKG